MVGRIVEIVGIEVGVDARTGVGASGGVGTRSATIAMSGDMYRQITPQEKAVAKQARGELEVELFDENAEEGTEDFFNMRSEERKR